MRMASAVSVLLLMLAAPTPAAAAPANDACAAATVIGVDFEEVVATFDATSAPDDPLQSCSYGGPAQNDRSIWYAFTAPANGVLSVYTYAPSLALDPDTVVTVHEGPCGATTEVACYDSNTSVGSYVHVPVVAATASLVEVTHKPPFGGTNLRVQIYFEPDSPICPSYGGDVQKAKLALMAIGAPAGDERLRMSARVYLEAALPDVATTGMQVLAEDVETAWDPIVEWSERTLAIPAGGPGTGCDPADGWTVGGGGNAYRYRNRSNAFPPACTPGSANGVTSATVRRKSAAGDVVDVVLKADGAMLASAVAPADRVRLAVTFAPTIAPSNAARCGVSFFQLRCTINAAGSKATCKVR
jgi:hypothetical protein